MKNLALTLLLIPALALSQVKTVTYLYDASLQPDNQPIDITHLLAEISIDPYDTVVTGKAVFTFRKLMHDPEPVVFRVPDFVEISVSVNGSTARSTRKGNELEVYLDEDLLVDGENTLIIKYLSKPVSELFFVGWNEPALRDRKVIWAHRPHHWLPYYEDRLTVDLFITFDENYLVYSNGLRKEVVKNKNGTKTWHYAMEKEHPFFSTALVIGPYRYKEGRTDGGLPLEMWYYEGEEERVEPTYRYMNEMFEFFEDEFGFAYPYELYRQAPVPDYLYGAMETTTATIFGDYMLVDDSSFHMRSYVNVNAHELAHQWFGNCLSHLRNRDVWLTESFATYYAKMFEKYIYGEERYEEIRLEEWTETLEAAGRDVYAVGHGRGGRERWYPKGSLVMDMLREVLGEENFKASVKHYLEENRFSTVETGDFLASIREASGYSMEWFFDQWILRGGEPHFEVGYEKLFDTKEDPRVRVRVRQVHEINELTGVFRVPVEIQAWYTDGTFTAEKTWLDGELEIVDIPLDKNRELAFILFDPGERILKKLSFPRSLEELSYQATLASGLRDRYEAVKAMDAFPMDEKRDILQEIYDRESGHLVRTEVLRQFAQDPPAGLFARAMKDGDVYTRRAAMHFLEEAPEELEPVMKGMLYDLSYTNIEYALRSLYRSFPENYPKYLDASKEIYGWRGLNVRMAWLEIAILEGQREYLRELVAYAGPRYEFETRINAMHTLRKLNYLNEEAAMNLLHAYVYWNYKVSNAAREVILYFMQQEKMKRLIMDAYHDGTWNEREKRKFLVFRF